MNFIYKKYQSIKKVLLTYGLKGFWYYLIKSMKLISQRKMDLIYSRHNLPELQKIRLNLNNKIFKLAKNKIFFGPYKNTKIINDIKQTFNIYIIQQILGTYEINVQEYSIDLQKKYKLKNIVSFGSGNGFHPLGLIKNSYFKKAICFEKNRLFQKILIKNFKINNILGKLSCFSEASFKKVFDLLDDNELKRTLFIIDVEGDEYELLNNKIFNKIKNSYLIIENHDFKIKNKNKIKKIKKLLNKTFNVKIINSKFPKIEDYLYKINLNQDELVLSLFEKRKKMDWFICKPKN